MDMDSDDSDDLADELTTFFLIKHIRHGRLSIHDLSERHKKNPDVVLAALESVSQARDELKRKLSDAEKAARDAVNEHANERAELIADRDARVLKLEWLLKEANANVTKMAYLRKCINTKGQDPFFEKLEEQLRVANVAMTSASARIAELEKELEDLKQEAGKKRKRAPVRKQVPNRAAVKPRFPSPERQQRCDTSSTASSSSSGDTHVVEIDD